MVYPDDVELLDKTYMPQRQMQNHYYMLVWRVVYSKQRETYVC